jgi:branched-chain amino acid aminotransferase
MAKLEGLQAGCVEALMLNHKGEVAECTGDNIFVVRSQGGADRLLTPPPDAGILEGITRGAVMELAVAAGIDCREQALVRHDLYTADECFLTGTAAEVIPVVEIDGRRIGDGVPGPVTARLTGAFHNLVRA